MWPDSFVWPKNMVSAGVNSSGRPFGTFRVRTPWRTHLITFVRSGLSIAYLSQEPFLAPCTHPNIASGSICGRMPNVSHIAMKEPFLAMSVWATALHECDPEHGFHQYGMITCSTCGINMMRAHSQCRICGYAMCEVCCTGDLSQNDNKCRWCRRKKCRYCEARVEHRCLNCGSDVCNRHFFDGKCGQCAMSGRPMRKHIVPKWTYPDRYFRIFMPTIVLDSSDDQRTFFAIAASGDVYLAQYYRDCYSERWRLNWYYTIRREFEWKRQMECIERGASGPPAHILRSLGSSTWRTEA